MLEFKIIQELKPNTEILEIIKDYTYETKNCILFQNKLGFTFLWDSLNRKTKKELIQRLIASLEITRDKNYNIEIKNIEFTDEFISKSNKEYLDYLNEFLNNNEIGIKYSKQINKQELEKLKQDYLCFLLKNMKIINIMNQI